MNLGGNFLMLPFLLYFLNDNAYGVWNVYVSLGGIVALFDFGFNTTFARNITFCWSGAKKIDKESVESRQNLDNEPDFTLMKKVLITCKRIYLVISTAALILLWTFGTVYILYLTREIDSRGYVISWLIYSIAIFMNLYFGYYDSFLRGVGDIADVNKYKIYARIVQICLLAVLLYCGFGIIGASIAYLFYGFVFRTAAKRRFYSYQDIGRHLKSVTSAVTRSEITELFKVIWHNAWRDGLVSLANYLSNQVTVIIGSFYLSLAETGAYSLAVQLAQAIVQIASALYTAYQPTLQAAYVDRDKEKMKDSMSAILSVYVVTVIIGFAVLLAVGIPIIKLIKPSAVLSTSTILGVGLYQTILKGRNCYTSYISSTNRVPYAKAFIVSGVLCLAFSVILEELFDIGVWGLIAAQIASQLVFNAWYWPMFVHKELSLSPREVFPRGVKEVKKLILRKSRDDE